MIEVRLSHEHIYAIKRALRICLSRLHEELYALQESWQDAGSERVEGDRIGRQIDWFEAALDELGKTQAEKARSEEFEKGYDKGWVKGYAEGYNDFCRWHHRR